MELADAYLRKEAKRFTFGLVAIAVSAARRLAIASEFAVPSMSLPSICAVSISVSSLS